MLYRVAFVSVLFFSVLSPLKSYSSSLPEILIQAAKQGELDNIKQLIEDCPWVLSQQLGSVGTVRSQAVAYAAYNDSEDTVRWLLKQGGDFS